MAYIIKSTSGLNNTRFTDVGRQRLSEGKLDIRYFQIGDSEVSYDAIPNYNQTNNMILEAAHNAQNTTQEPETNKMHVKYPYYVKGGSGNTYGLAISQPRVDPIYNTAAPRGFFESGITNPFSIQLTSGYTKNSSLIYIPELLYIEEGSISFYTYQYNIDGIKFTGNNKSWRQCIYIDKKSSSIVFSRQYPSNNDTLSEAIRNLMENQISNYFNIENTWTIRKNNHFNIKDVNTFYDVSGFHYSDVSTGSYNFIEAKIKNTDNNNIKFNVGAEYSDMVCLQCGEHITASDEYLCGNCYN
jgi:hypothetical protein